MDLSFVFVLAIVAYLLALKLIPSRRRVVALHLNGSRVHCINVRKAKGTNPSTKRILWLKNS
jgi:hypothetical protein